MTTPSPSRTQTRAVSSERRGSAATTSAATNVWGAPPSFSHGGHGNYDHSNSHGSHSSHGDGRSHSSSAYSSGPTSGIWSAPAGPAGSGPRLGASYSFGGVPNSDAYRSGGIAWGTAQRSYSDSGRRSSSSSLGSSSLNSAPLGPMLSPTMDPSQLAPGSRRTSGPSLAAPQGFLAGLSPQPANSNLNNFTGPAVSLLDQFSTLVDATRQAELSRRGLHGPQPGQLSAQGPAQAPGPTTRPVQSSTLDTSRWNTFVPGAPLRAAPLPTSSPTPAAAKIESSTATSSSARSPITPPLGASGTSGSSVSSTPASLQRRGSQSGTQMAYSASAASSVTAASNGYGDAHTSPTTPPPQSRQKGRWRKGKPRSDSPLLDELRAKKGFSISSIVGNVVEVSTDQHGSRFIQENLADAAPEVRQAIFEETCAQLLPLTVDVFGNYVVQQLFELGTSDQQSQMIQRLNGHILSLTLQMYGCRVIQVALRYAGESDKVAIVAELRGSVVRCIKDHNGNHVIQKAIEYVQPQYVQFIYADLLSRTIELSQHMYGCRVVQRILEHADAETRKQLLSDLRSNLDRLVVDQYGNYVVQHIVDNGPADDRRYILDRLLPQVQTLSSHKYASNVVEKCFVRSSMKQRSQLVDRILQLDANGVPVVVGMVKDQYANYVIQKILATAEEPDYIRLVAAIRPQLIGLKKSSFGKHLAAIERLVNGR